MSRNSASNIRVSVQFTHGTVYAGEDLECVITFKNVARQQLSDGRPSRSRHQNGYALGERQRAKAPLPRPSPTPTSRISSTGPSVRPPLRKGHKSSLSRDTSPFPLTSTLEENEDEDDGPQANGRPRHGRSLSIISMGTDSGSGAQNGKLQIPVSRRASKMHSRSASTQSSGMRNATPTSPSFDSKDGRSISVRGGRKSPGSSKTYVVKPPGVLQTDFRFPSSQEADGPNQDDEEFVPDSAISPGTQTDARQLRPQPSRSTDDPSALNGSASNPIARVLNAASVEGTPRSSMDLYSGSNNSTETLASEYAPQPAARLLHGQNHGQASSISLPLPVTGPETLMMGYAQIMGSFTLDGSLVNQAPFEEIKRKGVVGGQGGGGVVGVERSKKESGLFGAFGWSNIGESLNGLLSGGEMSSIKEMNRIASSKSIPLISTTQSILFVDLRLAPGESRSYKYSFSLPRGLPPSHKGRAMKVSYHLTVGVQRPGTSKERQVRSIDIPFRVFGSVDARGEILGYDLMLPYIILRDAARTSSVSTTKPSKPDLTAGAQRDFLSYVDTLLESSTTRQGLLSPTQPPAPARRKSSVVAVEPKTQKDAIDFAILRANQLPASSSHAQLSNLFTIARSNRFVATMLLPRPAYKLGETIHLVISFANAVLPTYAVQVALETSEKVDPAIAMRSGTSVYRYTRRVHSYCAENCMFAKRASFALSIPASATPEFVTSGIALEWRIRVEFATARVFGDRKDRQNEDDDDEEDSKEKEDDLGRRSHVDLLEETSRDDRAMILRGVEKVQAETFEVSVPVRVYGAVVGGKDEFDVDELGI